MENNSFSGNYPDALSPKTCMSSPNEIINIHEGLIFLKYNDKQIILEGKIWFAWIPDIRVRCQGIVKEGNYSIKDSTESMQYEVSINNTCLGILLLNSFHISDHTELSGFIIKQIAVGDKKISVSKIHFEIPNLRYFHGEVIKFDSVNRPMISNSRLILDNDKYLIIIDKDPDFNSKKKILRENGGFLFLYTGLLKKKDDHGISYKEFDNLRECLSNFLSFINGSTCSPLFYNGVYEDQSIWIDYTPYSNNSYTDVRSWPLNHSIGGLNDLWREFLNLWKEPDDREFLKIALLWYLKSNSNSGLLEESIIYNQIALELIYNWYIGEKRQLISGKDRGRMQASNKIRILIKVLNPDYNLPDYFKYLSQNFGGDIYDEFDLITKVRNAVTHSYDENGNKPKQYSIDVLVEVVQLGLLIIEKSLLSILKFEHKFKERKIKDWE